MTVSSFSHLVFFVDPIKSLAFFSIGMALASLWIRKTAWLWGSFAVISLILAYSSHVIAPLVVIPITLIIVLNWTLTLPVKGLLRLTLFGMLFLIASALCFHFMPGFTNWKIVDGMQISPGGLTYTLWMNFDKAFVGLLYLYGCHLYKQFLYGKNFYVKACFGYSLAAPCYWYFLKYYMS